MKHERKFENHSQGLTRLEVTSPINRLNENSTCKALTFTFIPNTFGTQKNLIVLIFWQYQLLPYKTTAGI
jgi:hypothetical protein